MKRPVLLVSVALRAAGDDGLLKPKFRGSKKPLAGHCYVVSEAAYHLLGGKAAGWVPYTLKHEGRQHWWIQRGEVVLDLTAGQFRTAVPYARGRACGFLTREPSLRARTLLARVA